MAAPRPQRGGKTPKRFNPPVPVAVDAADVANYVADARQQLLPVMQTLQNTDTDIKNAMALQLARPQAALMMSDNDIRAAYQKQLQLATAAAQASQADVTAQMYDRVGAAIAQGQAADSSFPNAAQLASTIYPQLQDDVSGAGVDECLAQAGLNYQQALARCAAQYHPSIGQDQTAYQQCVASAKAGYDAAVAACNAAGSGTPGGGVGGAHPTPGSPSGPGTPATYQPPIGYPPGVPAGPGPGPTQTTPLIPVTTVPQPGSPGVLPLGPGAAGTPGGGVGQPAAPAAPPRPVYEQPPAPGEPSVTPPIVSTPAPGPSIPGQPVTPPVSPGPAPTGESFPPGPGPQQDNPPPVQDVTSSSSAKPPVTTVTPGSCPPSPYASDFIPASTTSTEIAPGTMLNLPGLPPMMVSGSGFSNPPGPGWVLVGPKVNERLVTGWYWVNCNAPAAPPKTSTSSGQCCPVNITLNCPGSSVGTPPPSSSSPPAASNPGLPGGDVKAVEGSFLTCGLPPIGILDWSNSGHQLARWMGLRNNDGSMVDTATTWGATGIVRSIMNGVISLFAVPVDFFDTLWSKLVPNQGCANNQYFSLQATRTLADFFGKWIGGGLDGLQNKATQQAHQMCPSMLPSPDNAIEAYLANQISLDTATCWARAGDSTETEWKKLVDARQTRLNSGEVLQLWRRQLIADKEADERLRELGYIEPLAITDLKALTEQIPPASDLTMMMVRDVADPEVYERFKLDTNFTDKFQGKIAEWADAQGVSKEYMQYIWRAHWTIPSPTQLFDFWHRLRKDPAFGNPDELWANIENALKQQDILPFWIPYFQAASYHVPTRIDARRMYRQGAIDKEGLTLILTRQGYSDEDAANLANFYETDRDNSLIKSPIVKQYVSGEINRDELVDSLKAQGATDETLQRALDAAQLQQTAKRRKICHAAWRKKFLSGEIDRPKALQLLIDDGLNSDVAQQLVDGWTCELKTKSKTIPTAQACKLFNQGIISQVDYYQRLINIGYSNADALALLEDCNLKGIKAKGAEQQKQLKRLQQIAKAQDQANRREQAAEQKQLSTAQHNLDKARAVSKARRGLMIETAFNFANNTGDDPATAMDVVRSVSDQLVGMTKATLDQVLQAGPKVAKSATVTNPDDLSREWLAVLQQLQLV